MNYSSSESGVIRFLAGLWTKPQVCARNATLVSVRLRSLAVPFLVALFLFLLAGLGPAENLIANGDFSAPLDSGWTVYSTGDQGTATRAASPPSHARVFQSYKGKVTLYQVIPVTSLDLSFSFSGRFRTEVSKTGYGATAKLAIVFCDADTEMLGRTVFGRASGLAKLTNSTTTHVVVAKEKNKWANYSLNLRQELAKYLPEVDPDKVEYLRIGLTADNGDAEGC